MEIKSYEVSSDNLDEVVSKFADLLKENLKADEEETKEKAIEHDDFYDQILRLERNLVEALEDDIEYGFKSGSLTAKADLLISLMHFTHRDGF